MELSPPSPTYTRTGASLMSSVFGSRNSTGQGYRQISVAARRSVSEKGGRSGLSSGGTARSDTLEMDAMNSSSEEGDLTDDEETGLTHKELKRRRRRKHNNQHLDQRIASGGEDDPGKDKVEKQVIRAAFIKNMLINVTLIGLWYGFSISISVYNKWMFSDSNLNFPFPLFTTSLHMLVQFSLASLVLYIFPRFRPGASPSNDPHGQGYSQLNNNPNNEEPIRKPLMTKSFYLTRISPCGTATALDIGLGNFSLRFITLTFYTMCKSSVLAFVLVFAFIFRLESPTWKLTGIIALMTAGVIMMVAGETDFNLLGFALVMCACFCSGFRWSLTQILLLRNAATSNPFSSIFYLTPVMFLALFVLALPIEGPANVVAGFHTLAEAKGTLFALVILIFPGFLAFMMVAAEFALLQRTSVVTLSVTGIFKEVLTISAASITFGDELSPINVSGLCVTILSIAGYNILKYSKMRKDVVKQAHEIRDGPNVAEEEYKGERVLDETEFEIGRDSLDDLSRDSMTSAANVEQGGGGSAGAANRNVHGHAPPESLNVSE